MAFSDFPSNGLGGDLTGRVVWDMVVAGGGLLLCVLEAVAGVVLIACEAMLFVAEMVGGGAAFSFPLDTGGVGT